MANTITTVNLNGVNYIRIDFEFDTPYGKYADALLFPDDQPLPSDAEIEAMKQERLTNWLNAINQPPYEEPQV